MLNLFDFGCAIVQAALIAAPLAIGVEAEMALVYETHYGTPPWADLPGLPIARAWGPLALFGVIVLALLRRKRLPDPERRTLNDVDRAFLQGVIIVGVAAGVIGCIAWGPPKAWIVGALLVPAVGLWLNLKLWGGWRRWKPRIGGALWGTFVGGLLGAIAFGVVHSIVVYLADPFDPVLQRWAGGRAAISGLLTGALMGCWLVVMASMDREAFDRVYRRRIYGKKPNSPPT